MREKKKEKNARGLRAFELNLMKWKKSFLTIKNKVLVSNIHLSKEAI